MGGFFLLAGGCKKSNFIQVITLRERLLCVCGGKEGGGDIRSFLVLSQYSLCLSTLPTDLCWNCVAYMAQSLVTSMVVKPNFMVNLWKGGGGVNSVLLQILIHT